MPQGIFPTNPDWLTVKGTTSRSDSMWIEVEHSHKQYVDAAKLDTVRVEYTSGRYKVIGTIGDRDLCLKGGMLSSTDAYEFIDGLVKQLRD